MSSRWEVTYTGDAKTKKNPKFKDGSVIVRVAPTGLRRAILFDENNKQLEDRLLKSSEEFKENTNFYFDRFSVQILKQLTKSPSKAEGVQESVQKKDEPPFKRRKLLAEEERRTTAQVLQRLQKPSKPSAQHDREESSQGLAESRPQGVPGPSTAVQCTRPIRTFKAPQPCQEVQVLGQSASSSTPVQRTKPDLLRNRSFKAPQMTAQPQHVKFEPGGLPPARRQVVIPDVFNNLAAYKSSMSSAIIEEINFAIAEFASRYKTARDHISTKPSCKHGPTVLRVVRKEGDNVGRSFYTCASSPNCMFSWADALPEAKTRGQRLSAEELEQGLSCYNINFFAMCEILKRKPGHQSDRPGLVRLKLGRSCKQSKGDVWIISSSLNFDKSMVATSESYGTAVIELRFFGTTPEGADNVYALQGPNVLTEIYMLEGIRKLQPTPFVPLLLGSSRYSFDIPGLVASESACEDAIAKYKLNEDQANVLRTVNEWFYFESRPVRPDVCLVHGPFGTGKSRLLVVLILFLSELLKNRDDTTVRFIVSAATNVAVDRVLTGLLEHGFEDFVRVGCLRSIASNVLPYSVHASKKADVDDEEAENDLKALLKDSVGSARLKIENELKALRSGKMAHRRQRLKHVRVVGVTCCSAVNKVLEGARFKVCFLDECSQMVEPLSMLPLCNFSCEKLVAVGDPKQLPPFLYRSGELSASSSSADLSRTLFSRLAALGHKPMLLHLQYRCHPRLAAVPNRLFYEGTLQDGCSEDQRPPLLSNLNPVVFVNTAKRGKETKQSNNSYLNHFEAEMACSLIRVAILKGISGSRIGVIVLYKAQEALIRTMLHPEGHQMSRMKKVDEAENVQVSTVDAFQGSEKDIVILSCCRTDGLGFLASPNRLNVAITRARHHLIIIGDASNLGGNELWKELLRHVRSTPNCFKTADDIQKYIENENPATMDSAAWTEGGGESDHIACFTREELPPVSSELMNDVEKETAVSRVQSILNEEFAKAVEEDECTVKMMGYLHDVAFSPRDFWQGYKLYCVGHYSHSVEHREAFEETLMARVLRRVHGDNICQWGLKFDSIMRSSWCIMEDYVKQHHGVDCGDIRFLMREYDDPAELAASKYGQLLLHLCEDGDSGIHPRRANDKESDEATEESVVDILGRRLSDIDANLAKLMQKRRSSQDALPSFDLGLE